MDCVYWPKNKENLNFRSPNEACYEAILFFNRKTKSVIDKELYLTIDVLALVTLCNMLGLQSSS